MSSLNKVGVAIKSSKLNQITEHLNRINSGIRRVTFVFSCVFLVLILASYETYTYVDIDSGERVDRGEAVDLEFSVCRKAWNQYFRSHEPSSQGAVDSTDLNAASEDLSNLLLANAIVERLGPPAGYRMPAKYFFNGCLEFHGIRSIRRWLWITQDDTPPWLKTTKNAKSARQRAHRKDSVPTL